MAGDVGFDPLLLSNIVPLKWSREAELKHGRTCMLAIVGWLGNDYVPAIKFPGAELAGVSSLLASTGLALNIGTKAKGAAAAAAGPAAAAADPKGGADPKSGGARGMLASATRNLLGS